MGFWPTRTLTALALLLALPLGAQSLGQRRMDLPARENPALEGSEPDRPDLRRDWNLWWFGGKLSPAYLDYKNHLAAQEMRRWGALMPQAQGTRLLPQIIGGAAAPAGTGGTWVNLGPTANLTTTSFPDIDSGRPAAILADPATPTTLYLATSGGGVFKSTNADLATSGDWTWKAMTDGLPNSGSSGNVSVGAMAMDPANSQILYLGLGDPFDAEGRGFYKSTDGGNSWTAATGLGNATISYAILPLSASRVFWGTNDGLKVSNDGGATFTPASGGPASGMVWTVQKLSASDLVCSVETATYGPGSIYYSNDGGATWQTTNLPATPFPIGRITLATSPASGTIIWGLCEDITNASTGNTKVARGLLKSVDKGATWTWVAAPTISGGLFLGTGPSMSGDGGQGFYNHGLAVDPTNANHVFVGSNLALYRTLDGGITWAQMTHWYGNMHVYAHADFHATAWSGDGATLYTANDGGLCIVRDPFRATIPTGTGTVASDPTFIDNRRNKGLITHLVYNVGSTTAASPTDSKYRISLGLQDNGTRIRQPNTPGGSLTGTEGTFEDQVGGDGFATLINPVDGNQMLGSIYYTQIYKSTDGGATPFNPSSSGILESNKSSLAPFQPRLAQGDAAHPNTVYTATNGTVYQSLDFGSSWSALSTTGLPPGGTNSSSDPSNALYIRNIGAAASNSNALGIVANQGRVYLSYNGGTSWTQGGTLTNNGSYTSSIWFDRSNPQIVYVASVAPNATKNHLWKSANGGVSWTALDTTSNGFPFGIPVHVVETDPKNASTIYAGTDFGVYYSIDGGSNWNRFGSDLPMVAVRDLYLAPDDSFLRAATFGRGVWELQASAGVSVSLDKTTVTLNPSATTTFTAAVTSFVTDNSVNWTVSTGGGTVSPAQTASGTPTTYTAPAQAGIYTVTAASNEAPKSSASATVNVYNPAAVTVSVTPATKTLITGGAFTFSATVANAPDSTVAWSVSPSGGGTITSAGAYTAPTTPGTYTVTATSTWSGTAPGMATVTVKTLDLNGDGTVDQRDLLFFAKYYGTVNATCNLDGSIDGLVTDADLAILLGGL